jgi:AraC family transcriptional regulator
MLSLRVTDYPVRGMMAPHYHEEPSFIVVVGGAYLEQIQGSEVEHRPGHMLFYPASTTHSQRFGPGGTRKLVFTPERSSIEYLQERGVSVDSARYVSDPIISQLAQRILAEMQSDDTFTALAMNGVLLELVAAFARRERRAEHGAPPVWMRAVRDFVHANADRNLSLDEIGANAGKHPVHVAKEFRRYYGATIGAYQRQLRLQRAEALLLRRNVDLTEVALACGFANHSHFCRSFKAAYGITPSQFRSQRA